MRNLYQDTTHTKKDFVVLIEIHYKHSYCLKLPNILTTFSIMV